MKRKVLIPILAFLLVLSVLHPNFASAYTDYSTYNLETKEQFAGSKTVQSSIDQLKKIMGGMLLRKSGSIRKLSAYIWRLFW
ncbi:hypothetical protein AAGG52_21765 [Bacillus licheniformis]